VRPDRELNAWLLPVEGGNAVALVRIRNVDGKKVGIYRVDDVGFPCPAKGSDLSPKQVKAIREEALKVDPIVVDANGPATEILKVKITAAGAEFPAVVVTAA
jgi:hypothetical protein